MIENANIYIFVLTQNNTVRKWLNICLFQAAILDQTQSVYIKSLHNKSTRDIQQSEGPVTLPKIRVNAWITHKIWLCVLVRREFDHFCWLTWWKITDELRKNYGKITHKSLTNHALQRIGTKRPQTGRMRGCAWRIRDGKPRIISALSLVNCVWIAHDSRMNCAKNAQEALKLRSFRAYKTDAAAVPWHSRFNSRRQHIVSSSASSSPFSSVSGPPKILTISEY